ncbi:hypothetical protein LCGC14_2092340, partial [marine sediment metagenome]
LPSLVSANVDSVSLGKNGSVTLNLAGMGSIALSDVQQINQYRCQTRGESWGLIQGLAVFARQR